MQLRAALIAILAAVILTPGKCQPSSKRVNAKSISFVNDVVPVLTRSGCNQGTCHGAAAGKNGFRLTLRGYAPELDYYYITRELTGRRICKAAPETSLFLRKPLLEVPHMGGQVIRRDSPEYRILADWLSQAAPGPGPSDTHVVSLKVVPPQQIANPKQQLNFRVYAKFSDGSTRDVTHWTRFATNDENVATVKPDGAVTIAGEGETAITAGYQSSVAIARVTSPFPYKMQPKAYFALQRSNFIDEHIYRKLRSLNLWPSERSSDAQFARRLYVDLIGTLPAPNEIEAFCSDRDPTKRAKLIDTLMSRPEFVDFWTYKWCDLFRVNRGTLKDKGMWAFYAYLHDAVRTNKPWNTLCGEVLTSTGNTFLDGPANYFRTALKPEELAENISQGFLGIRVGCAHCHNHPLEKWTQNDYYGMANIFARVKWKADLGIYVNEEMTVYNAPEGDLIQPRLGKPLPPKPLGSAKLALDRGGDRRRAFAEWLDRPDNWYFSHCIVNRVWKHFMGVGLVEQVDDLRETNPPTNPELFDALAADFVKHGYDLRHLMRTIANSQSYQLSSAPNPRNALDDRYFSRYFVRRLTAEEILDAVGQVTGVPELFPGMPPGYKALQLPDTHIKSEFMDSFGRPPRQITCECERTQEPSMTQALLFINGEMVNQKVTADGGLADRLVKANKPDNEIIDALYLTALGRKPAVAERKAGLAAIHQAILNVKNEPAVTKPAVVAPVAVTASAQPKVSDKTTQPPNYPNTQLPNNPQQARRRAFEDLLWVLVNSKEFLFNH